jgi:hypothetical protein
VVKFLDWARLRVLGSAESRRVARSLHRARTRGRCRVIAGCAGVSRLGVVRGAQGRGLAHGLGRLQAGRVRGRASGRGGRCRSWALGRLEAASAIPGVVR